MYFIESSTKMPHEQTLQLERVPGVNNNGGQLLYIFFIIGQIYITTNKKTKEEKGTQITTNTGTQNI